MNPVIEVYHLRKTYKETVAVNDVSFDVAEGEVFGLLGRNGAGVLLWFVMMILSGAGPPPEVLNTAMRTVSNLTPLKYVVLLLQDPWLGFRWDLIVMGIVFGFLIVPALLIARFFRWE